MRNSLEEAYNNLQYTPLEIRIMAWLWKKGEYLRSGDKKRSLKCRNTPERIMLRENQISYFMDLYRSVTLEELNTKPFGTSRLFNSTKGVRCRIPKLKYLCINLYEKIINLNNREKIIFIDEICRNFCSNGANQKYMVSFGKRALFRLNLVCSVLDNLNIEYRIASRKFSIDLYCEYFRDYFNNLKGSKSC